MASMLCYRSQVIEGLGRYFRYLPGCSLICLLPLLPAPACIHVFSFSSSVSINIKIQSPFAHAVARCHVIPQLRPDSFIPISPSTVAKASVGLIPIPRARWASQLPRIILISRRIRIAVPRFGRTRASDQAMVHSHSKKGKRGGQQTQQAQQTKQATRVTTMGGYKFRWYTLFRPCMPC